MANLSLKTRRMLARGISRRTARLWGNRVFMGDGNRAQLTTAMTGANNDITFLAKTPRTPGNAVRVRIVVAGVSTALSVSVSGNDITINSATNASSVATSPAVDVIRAVNRDAAASLLVHAQRATGNDGTGVVTALAFTNLAGAS